MHYDGVMEKAKKDEELLSCELFLEKWGNTGISSYKLIYNELKAKIPPTFRRDLEKQRRVQPTPSQVTNSRKMAKVDRHFRDIPIKSSNRSTSMGFVPSLSPDISAAVTVVE